MNIDYFNNKILELWKDQDVSDFVPMLYNEPNKNSILFIGINPSFSKKGFKTILKDKNILKDPKQFYSYNNFSENKIEKLKSIELEARSNLNYFRKFEEIANYLNLYWDHIDLLQIRKTEQDKIKNMIKQNGEFFKKQILLTLELIDYIQPKIIVVENAFVRKILTNEDKKKYSYNEGIISEIDSSIGTNRYKDIPIFFTSMLSGQRALDNGSYERLKWHIKFVLDKEKEG